MSVECYKGALAGMLSCCLAAPFGLLGQEAPAPPQVPTQVPPAYPGAPVATPVQTGESEFATDRPMTTGPGAVPGALPPQMPQPQQPLPPQQQEEPKKPMGPTVSPMQSRSRVIEDMRPQRVPVYPEDQDSAWWEINPRYAFARAQREQRPMLLLFTGMWNTQAMALSEEVFSTRSFNEYVKENLVICYLSYPRNQTDAPDALRQIKEKFKVRGYPNVLIFNPNGEVEKGIRGYHTGRPVDYFNELKAACGPVLASIEARRPGLMRKGFRDWSNYLGKEIFARFVKHDMTYVALQDMTGMEWLIKINDLAPDDQKLVESFPRVDKIETGEGEAQ